MCMGRVMAECGSCYFGVSCGVPDATVPAYANTKNIHCFARLAMFGLKGLSNAVRSLLSTCMLLQYTKF
jgi:hypothetical protein